MKAVIETFKEIPGYEGIYEISDYGCVRSLKYGKVKYLRNKKHGNGYECIGLSRDSKLKWFMVHRLVWEAFNGTITDGYEIDHINTIRDDNRLVNLRVVTHKENQANPISVEKHREGCKQRSQDPKWRESVREGVNRRSKNTQWLENLQEAAKRRSQDHQWIEANRKALKKMHSDPKWREAHREANRKARNKPVLQLNMVTGEVIREWECAADASRELGINFSNISACCRGNRNSAGGFNWKFADQT